MNEGERRVVLRLNLSDNEQRNVWELISSIPKGQRNKYLCQLVLKNCEQEDMRGLIYNAVRQALDEHSEPYPQKENKGSGQAGEIRSDILGFLSALQEEGDP